MRLESATIDRDAHGGSKGQVWAVLAGCWALSGCVHGIEEQQSRAGDLLRDCVVPAPAGVAELGAPSALEYPDGSLWIWSSVALVGGQVVYNVSAFLDDAAALCASGVRLYGARDLPRSLLQLDAAELVANTERDDGRALRLEPSGGFVEAGVGYLFYDHVLTGPGVFDAQSLGTGLCRIEERDGACERLRPGGNSILWPPESRSLNRGGLVADDRAWVLGCRSVAAFSDVCTLSGAPLDGLETPASYQLWSAFGGWVDDERQASAVLEQGGAVTLSRFDGKYAAFSLDVFASRFQVRLSAPPPTSARSLMSVTI